MIDIIDRLLYHSWNDRNTSIQPVLKFNFKKFKTLKNTINLSPCYGTS